jgi:hypothetical protein
MRSCTLIDRRGLALFRYRLNGYRNVRFGSESDVRFGLEADANEIPLFDDCVGGPNYPVAVSLGRSLQFSSGSPPLLIHGRSTLASVMAVPVQCRVRSNRAIPRVLLGPPAKSLPDSRRRNVPKPATLGGAWLTKMSSPSAPQAEQCRPLAKGTYDEATRVMLTRMATECDVKADRLERKTL